MVTCGASTAAPTARRAGRPPSRESPPSGPGRRLRRRPLEVPRVDDLALARDGGVVEVVPHDLREQEDVVLVVALHRQVRAREIALSERPARADHEMLDALFEPDALVEVVV